MQWTIQEHELGIQRFAEQNTAQEVILNKLNQGTKRKNERKQKQLKKLLKWIMLEDNNDQQCWPLLVD